MTTNNRYQQIEKCVNCGWNMGNRNRKNPLARANLVSELPAPERELLTIWLPNVNNIGQRILCKDCESLLHAGAQAEGEGRARGVSHPAVCAACGDSILKKRWKNADAQQPHDQYIFQECLKIPIEGEMKVCRPCTQSAGRVIENRMKCESSKENKVHPDENTKPDFKQLRSGVKLNSEPTLPPEPVSTPPKITNLKTELILDGYMKVLGKSGGKCAVCDESASRRLNLPTRQKLLLRLKLYVSTGASVCERHRIATNWNEKEHKPCSFTGEEIADMVFLLKANWPINFEKLEELDPFVLDQWIGMSIEDFQKEYEKSTLKEQKGGKYALAVYFAHLHTGECATVLASLSQRTRGAVETALKMAKEHLSKRALENTAQQQAIVEHGVIQVLD